MTRVLSDHPARTTGAPRRTLSLPALFVLAFLAGTALVVLGEFLADWPALVGVGRLGVATAGPVLVMALYYALARRTVRGSGGHTLGQVADSLYFLGFMFTLVALLSALVTLVEIDTAGIVSRFGLALVTTLAGLLAKVTLTQFTVGLDERRAHAEAAIERAMIDMERALDAGTSLLDRRIETVSARIDAGAGEMLERVDRTCHEQVARLHEAGERFLADLDRGVRALGERADAERERLDELAARSDERSRALLERTEAHLTGFVDASERHASTLAERLDALGTAANERSVALLDRSEAELAGFVDVSTRHAKTLSDRFETLGTASTERADALLERGEARLAEVADTSDRHARALASALATALESVQGLVERQREHGRLLDEATEALRGRAAEDGALEVLAERTARMCEGVLQGAERLERASGDRDVALDARVGTLAAVAERVVEELAALRDEQRTFEERRLEERAADRAAAEAARERARGREPRDGGQTGANAGPDGTAGGSSGLGDGRAANEPSGTAAGGRWRPWSRTGTGR